MMLSVDDIEEDYVKVLVENLHLCNVYADALLSKEEGVLDDCEVRLLLVDLGHMLSLLFEGFDVSPEEYHDILVDGESGFQASMDMFLEYARHRFDLTNHHVDGVYYEE